MNTDECISHKPQYRKLLTYWLICAKGICVTQKWLSLTVFKQDRFLNI